MTTQQAIHSHGIETSEEIIGTEDRLLGYADGSYGWQARGSAEVYVFSNREQAIADYSAT